MGHQYTIVLVKSCENPEEEAEKLLAPYNKRLEVEPYTMDCYCIGSKALLEATKIADEKCGTIDKLQSDFLNRKKEEFLLAWESITRPWREARKEAFKAHPDKDKPNKDCPRCKGEGKFETTQNPNGEWDYYVLGGRWDGVLAPGNIISVEELITNDKLKAPFAVITPDGKWRDEGWGEARNEEWKSEFRKLLEQNRDCIALGYDLHY